MVECTGFENQQGRKLLEGSNPSLSAKNTHTDVWVFLFNETLIKLTSYKNLFDGLETSRTLKPFFYGTRLRSLYAWRIRSL